MAKTNFHIKGWLVDAKTNQPIINKPLITESGIRDDESLLLMLGVGPVARTDGDGYFVSTFSTRGFLVPTEIELHLEFGQGIWRCHVAPVIAHMIESVYQNTIKINLGRVEIDYEKCRIPTEHR